MSIVMNLLRSMVTSASEASPYDQFKARGCLYRVLQDSRQNMYLSQPLSFDECVITFEQDEEHWCLHFKNPKQQANNQYFFPVHTCMNLVTFVLKSGDKHFASFQWFVQPDGKEIVGCSMNMQSRDMFADLLCSLIQNEMPKYEKAQSHLSFCREVQGFPVYANSKQDPIKLNENLCLNTVLFQQAQMDITKLANTGKLFQIVSSQRVLLSPSIVFTIKSSQAFRYRMCIFESSGKQLLQKEINLQLNYQINQSQCYLKWFDPNSFGGKVNIYLVQFDKYDVTINVRFAFELYLYELRNSMTLQESLNVQQEMEEERADKLNGRVGHEMVEMADVRIEVETPFKIQRAKRVVKSERVCKVERNLTKMLCEETTNLKVESFMSPIEKASTLMEEQTIIKAFPEDLKKQRERKVHLGLEKFREKRVMTQAKMQNYTITSISNELQFLRLDSNNQLKSISTGNIYGFDDRPLSPRKIVMHDQDHKAMILSEGGHLSYCDLQTLKIIEQYAPEGVQDICPQRKLAQISKYDTFMGITDKGLHRIDPRIGKKAFQYTHDYRRQKKFSHITTTVEGWIAVGSREGDIRLYPTEQKQWATSKFAGLGDPVLALETTKDQRWLLVTYKTYLLLLPTFMGESSLFHKKTIIDNRPLAKKLTIKPQHLSMCKIAQLSLIPAHFDESTDKNEKYIVSGFNEYLVVWSLNKVIAGDPAYTFSKTEEFINQAEFRFNDPSKMLMASNHKVRVKESYVS